MNHTTTADKGELLPCPFCGGAPYMTSDGRSRSIWTVGCSNCDIHFGNYSREGAKKEWNRRPTNEGESILPLTESKTQTIIRNGYKITGYVLTHDDGRKAISDMQAVRWLEQGEFYGLMHPAPAGEGVGLPVVTCAISSVFCKCSRAKLTDHATATAEIAKKEAFWRRVVKIADAQTNQYIEKCKALEAENATLRAQLSGVDGLAKSMHQELLHLKGGIDSIAVDRASLRMAVDRILATYEAAQGEKGVAL